jgi:hypothetical protein
VVAVALQAHAVRAVEGLREPSVISALGWEGLYERSTYTIARLFLRLLVRMPADRFRSPFRSYTTRCLALACSLRVLQPRPIPMCTSHPAGRSRCAAAGRHGGCCRATASTATPCVQSSQPCWRRRCSTSTPAAAFGNVIATVPCKSSSVLFRFALTHDKHGVWGSQPGFGTY